MIIIMSTREDGTFVPPEVLAEEILEVAPDTKVNQVRGPISGVKVPEAAAVKWLMRTYTASGNKRKGV